MQLWGDSKLLSWHSDGWGLGHTHNLPRGLGPGKASAWSLASVGKRPFLHQGSNSDRFFTFIMYTCIMTLGSRLGVKAYQTLACLWEHRRGLQSLISLETAVSLNVECCTWLVNCGTAAGLRSLEGSAQVLGLCHWNHIKDWWEVMIMASLSQEDPWAPWMSFCDNLTFLIGMWGKRSNVLG
jgi:hypothetical protein